MTVTAEYAMELGRQVDELEAENERLRADLEAEKLAGVQPLADAIRLQEMYREEAERLKNELAKAQFQPNNRKLTRDIIRALILEVRTLRLELMQAQLMQVKPNETP